MTHVSEDDLILHYYGEGAADHDARVERHLAECGACRGAFVRLQQVLAAVDTLPCPDVNGAFDARVWNRLAPALPARRRFLGAFAFRPHQWAPAGAMAALLLAAFVAGRFWPAAPAAPERLAESGDRVRERVLLVTVGDHLERSQMVLVELLSTPVDGKVDLSDEQARAEDLLADNRLYRQTAASAGEAAVASLLDELERVLTEVASRPARISADDVDEIRQRIEAQGILFRVRVMSSQVRERGRQKLENRTTL
jgi:hypothetical protein